MDVIYPKISSFLYPNNVAISQPDQPCDYSEPPAGSQPQPDDSPAVAQPTAQPADRPTDQPGSPTAGTSTASQDDLMQTIQGLLDEQ